MITTLKVLRVATVVVSCAAIAMAQNYNSSNASTLSSSPIGLFAGGVVLLALGVVFGFCNRTKTREKLNCNRESRDGLPQYRSNEEQETSNV